MTSHKIQIEKFPRTHHLFALQTLNRDDLLHEKTDQFYKCPVTCEEKIDGSNIGFSLHPDNPSKIVVQNRSHYVTKDSHSQFKALDQWMQEHYDELMTVLQLGYLIFGEWMYAKHSILYDQLPGYFIAFDLFESRTKQYLSVAKRNQILQQYTTIPIIHPIVSNQVISTKQAYTQLLETNSFYCKPIKTNNNVKYQKVEGIYIRIDEGDYLKQRTKIVRSDFIQTIEEGEHWSGREMIKNQIDFSMLYNG